MKKEMMIQLPARKNIPATSIYIKIYIQSGSLGQRDILIMLPGGPGNDHTTYDAPDNSMVKALLPYVDIILFDPRGCGQSEKSAAQFCTLEHYIVIHQGIAGSELVIYKHCGHLFWVDQYEKFMQKIIEFLEQ